MSNLAKYRVIFYTITVFLVTYLLYLERRTLVPFVLAMIFAYIFTPLINFFHEKVKVPRTISIIVVYVLLIGTSVFLISLLAKSLLAESESIKRNYEDFIVSIYQDLSSSPEWIRGSMSGVMDYFTRNPLFGTFNSTTAFPFVSRAFFEILNFFIFMFAAFFFLRDGKKMIGKIISFFPEKYHDDITTLLQKINAVLASYLRGQLILIASMVIMLFVSFYILGVRYGLTLSIISALFEIVPIIGPIISAIFGTFIITISGGAHNLSLNSVQVALLVIAIYYISRQLQDYLIAPYVIGKATKLHPLVILFSVIAGEHLYGIVGVLTAVPLAATLKIIYEFLAEKLKINSSNR